MLDFRATSEAHMPGDETWGMFEIVLLLAAASAATG
jgi:hypothetical protein